MPDFAAAARELMLVVLVMALGFTPALMAAEPSVTPEAPSADSPSDPSSDPDPDSASGSEPQSPSVEPFIVQTCDSTLPGPERAAAAAERVRPALQAALAAKGLRFGDPVFLRAFKEEAILEMWIRQRKTGKYQLFRSWPIAAASGQLGPKLAEGDGQVPEGFYFVPPAGLKPDSTFHLGFNIGYPNAYDTAHRRTGTFIMIHGDEVSIGCLAMTDPKIEEIYTLCAAALKNGQPYFRVHIFPFRMTPARMARAGGDRWEDFWKNLREGYDWFETKRTPPDVSVVDLRYRFKE